MILADTTAWIDYLRGAVTPGAEALDRAIDTGQLVLGDLILTEIMRGLPGEKEAGRVWSHLRGFDVRVLCGEEIALRAARNYRHLRGKGITVRGTVDLIIATWCITNRCPLIHADRDFYGMEQHLGLQRWH
jgi:predicted nucleic acid-binding protein